MTGLRSSLLCLALAGTLFVACDTGDDGNGWAPRSHMCDPAEEVGNERCGLEATREICCGPSSGGSCQSAIPPASTSAFISSGTGLWLTLENCAEGYICEVSEAGDTSCVLPPEPVVNTGSTGDSTPPTIGGGGSQPDTTDDPDDPTAPGCTPKCDGKECGDNGCGGVCGLCLGAETCNAAGICASSGGGGGGSSCVDACIQTTVGCDNGVAWKCVVGADGCTTQQAMENCGIQGETCVNGECVGATTPPDDNPGCLNAVSGENGALLGEILENGDSYYYRYNGLLTQTGNANPDFLSLEFFSEETSFFDLASESQYQTCQSCVVIYQDFSSSDEPVPPNFMAQQGTLQVQGQVGGGSATFIFTDVVLAEVSIDPESFVSTVVPGGECFTLSGTFTGQMAD